LRRIVDHLPVMMTNSGNLEVNMRNPLCCLAFLLLMIAISGPAAAQDSASAPPAGQDAEPVPATAPDPSLAPQAQDDTDQPPEVRGAPPSAAPPADSAAAAASVPDAAEPPSAAPLESPPFTVDPAAFPDVTIVTVSPGVYGLGDIRLIKGKDRVEFPARVNMDKGPIEYLAVTSYGKVHESLLVTDESSAMLQAAFILMGFNGTENPLAMQGDTRLPEGDKVTVEIHWQVDGRVRSADISEWVINQQTDSVMKKTEMIYTGSLLDLGALVAQREGSIIAVYRDPAALIDNPLPEGANDEIWFVNQREVPPAGTAVTVSVQKSTPTP